MNSLALALGAGGARGLAHIHAIKAFDDLGLKPKIVAGTSMGSIIGAAACSGLSADEITDHIYSKISSPLSLMSDIFKVRPKSMGNFFDEGGPRIGELNLERILGVFLPDAIPDTFADLNRLLWPENKSVRGWQPFVSNGRILCNACGFLTR
jgi:NTE family protein